MTFVLQIQTYVILRQLWPVLQAWRRNVALLKLVVDSTALNLCRRKLVFTQSALSIVACTFQVCVYVCTLCALSDCLPFAHLRSVPYRIALRWCWKQLCRKLVVVVWSCLVCQYSPAVCCCFCIHDSVQRWTILKLEAACVFVSWHHCSCLSIAVPECIESYVFSG